MKYATFVRFRALAVAGLILLPVAAWLGCRKATTPPPIAVATNPANAGENLAPVQNADSNAPAANTASSGDTAAFTDVHRAILRLQKEPLSNGQPKGGTIQWVYKDAGIRAEFRCDKDKGFDCWNRVKIDYNGNKKDDERWDFKKDGTVKRRVAPNDDGNFTEEYTLEGESWVKK